MKIGIWAFALSLLLQGAAGAETLEIVIDAESARAVLAAVSDPALTRERALEVARLPGNQGLIEKVKSYGRKADDDLLADALLAAARHEVSVADEDYGFAKVRDNAAVIQKTLTELLDPAAHTMDEVKGRVLSFTPERIHGHIDGYLIAGGNSGGFAFGTPKFYLNMHRFPSKTLATTILEHELYHAVQGMVPDLVKAKKVAACLKKIHAGENLALLYQSLYQEGSASYVGDMLLTPVGADEAYKTDQTRAQNNYKRFGRSVTLLEISAHALATDSKAKYDDIYALGFYGEEILYSIGYVMARAIATERGPAALGDLLDKPPSDFVSAYAALKSYGKDKGSPKLGAETIQWAARVGRCRP